MDNEKLKIEKIEAIPKCEHAEQTATEPEKEKVDPNKKVATPHSPLGKELKGTGLCGVEDHGGDSEH